MGGGCRSAGAVCPVVRHQRLKAVSLLVFGLSLMLCYAASAVFHGVPYHGAPLGPYQRFDHIGIYMLIAGTYTPIVWSMMRGPWLWGTLSTVWTIAILSAARVWFGGVLPIWVSTPIYLVMGWGSLFCYRELARTYSHRKLMPLPLGGIFYSVGAIINLLKWPVLAPGVFGAHELFHLFVIAGSASHVYFMLQRRDPGPVAAAPAGGGRSTGPRGGHRIAGPGASRRRPALLLRWARAVMSRRVRRWMLHLPHPRWLEVLLIDPLDGIPSEGPAEVV